MTLLTLAENSVRVCLNAVPGKRASGGGGLNQLKLGGWGVSWDNHMDGTIKKVNCVGGTPIFKLRSTPQHLLSWNSLKGLQYIRLASSSCKCTLYNELILWLRVFLDRGVVQESHLRLEHFSRLM